MNGAFPRIDVRAALRANAAFSGVSGLALLFAAPALAAILGPVGPLTLRGIGIGLLLFSVSLVRLAGREPVPAREVRGVVVADVAWVVGSAALIATPWLRPAGDLLVGAVGLVVAAFAALQWTGLRRYA